MKLEAITTIEYQGLGALFLKEALGCIGIFGKLSLKNQ
jgi:hypothetical protein